MSEPTGTESLFSAEEIVRQALLVSACDYDGACGVECGEVPPLANCCRHRGLVALDALLAQRGMFREALKGIEWCGYGPTGDELCPECEEEVCDGHAADCTIAAALEVLRG